jgi:hypothetical protein
MAWLWKPPRHWAAVEGEGGRVLVLAETNVSCHKDGGFKYYYYTGTCIALNVMEVMDRYLRELVTNVVEEIESGKFGKIRMFGRRFDYYWRSDG